MRNSRIIGGMIVLASIASVSANDSTKSFFSVRPFTDTLMAQKLTLQKEHGAHKQRNAQFTAFGSMSTESDDLARYFFQGQTELTVREEAPAGDWAKEMQQDVLARDFNIISTTGLFVSSIKIQPRQTVYGGTFALRGYYGETQQWSLALEVPFLHVKNDLRFEETIAGTFTENGALFLDQQRTVASMKDAFKQQGLKYGKIDGARKKTGVGDVVVKVGYEPCAFCTLDDKYMNTYLGIIMPSSNKPKAEYMFEPILGNGGHAGFMMGTSFEAVMKTGKNYRFWSRWNIESRYLIENTQKRSFDLLQNGVWSRYLQMFEDATQLAASKSTFGMNILTLDSKVRPGYQGMVDMTLCVAGDKWHGSLGMTTFARQSEKIKLANAWTIAPYLASYDDVTDSNRFRQSGRGYEALDGTAVDIPLKEADLDLDSAAHPATISQMVYATVGGYKEGDKPCMYEVGGSYEFSCINTSLNRWGVWALLQHSF